MQYLKLRAKHYVSVIIGLFIGFSISQIMTGESDFSNAIIIVGVGLVIGEFFVFVKWFRQKNKYVQDN